MDTVRMDKEDNTERLILNQYRAHPGLQIQDLFKFLYQSSFGCEHMVSSASDAAESIKNEYDSGSHGTETDIEPLDGAYSRVPVAYMDRGLSAETFGRLFAASSKHEEDGSTRLVNKLERTKTLIDEGKIPFDIEEFDRAVSVWEIESFPALHHSDAYRELYHPSYRVIANKYVTYLPVFARIETELASRGKIIVAIEGGSASGKSTLGDILEEIYGCTLFHMDDYFLRPDQRTPERLEEAGGNVDRERFLAEVLQPLSAGDTVKYRKFDCSTMTLGEEIAVCPENIVVVEGAYSMHPELEKYYDISFFLDITPEEQRRRISRRNSPEMAERFCNEWIPMENRYFEVTEIKKRCTVVCPFYN